MKSNPVKIKGNWFESLIMCPSQCSLAIEFKKKNYSVYLRWRWSDPWTVSMVEGSVWGMSGLWVDLDIPDFSHDELPFVKPAALNAAIEYLIKNK